MDLARDEAGNPRNGVLDPRFRSSSAEIWWCAAEAAAAAEEEEDLLGSVSVCGGAACYDLRRCRICGRGWRYPA